MEFTGCRLSLDRCQDRVRRCRTGVDRHRQSAGRTVVTGHGNVDAAVVDTVIDEVDGNAIVRGTGVAGRKDHAVVSADRVGGGNQHRPAQGIGGTLDVIASRAFGLIRENRVAGEEFDFVVAIAAVGPDGLLCCWTDRDLVVAAQCIDDDGLEVAFRRQEAPDQLGLLELDGLGVGVIFRVFTLQRVEVDLAVRSFPDQLTVTVGRREAQFYLGVEGEIAVVIRQAHNQMLAGQDAGLRHKVNGNHIVGIRAAIVPDLVGLAGKLLPVVAPQTAVKAVKAGTIGAVQLVVAAVAVKEIKAGAAPQGVVLCLSEHAVETGLLDGVLAVAVMVVKHTGAWVSIDAEMRCQLQRTVRRGNRNA